MKTIQKRFWDKVTKLPESEGGHWLWTGALDHNGYGKLRACDGTARTYIAHRLSLAWATGDDGRDDSKGCPRNCVNPAHLEWKSHRDNCIDIVLKHGRLGRRIDGPVGREISREALRQAEV